VTDEQTVFLLEVFERPYEVGICILGGAAEKILSEDSSLLSSLKIAKDVLLDSLCK